MDATSAVNFPINPNKIAITAAPPTTYTEATRVIATTPVFSPYVVFAGPPSAAETNVANPSPKSVLSRPGSCKKSRFVMLPKTL